MIQKSTSTKNLRNKLKPFKFIHLTALFLIFSSNFLNAQNLQYEWAYNIGAAISAQDRSGDITTDLAGNVYTTGSYLGTFDFDPGPGIENRSSSFFDAFVSKLDANGDFVWATNFGGTNSDVPSAIFVDGAENVYITGTFYNSGDFDFGAGTSILTSNGQVDVYIIKINAAGNFEWAKSFGGTGFDYGSDINVDQNGNVYVTGVFSSTVDFDPGPGTQTATANSSNNNYILKLDASGNFDWVNTYAGFFSFGGGQSIVTDANGDIYASGGFSSTVDMDPGAGISNITSNGGDDIFITKLDASGNFIWAKNLGGPSFETPRSLEIDNSGNLYLCGRFAGTADFDPGAGTSNTVSNGDDDIFVVKLDANGDYLWAKGMGGLDDDEALALSVDVDGNTFTTGSFRGTVDFDPGTGTFNLSSVGFQDAFISKLDANGNFVWVKSVEGIGRGLSADVLGSLYITGDFNDTVDMDPGNGVVELISNGSTDIFVLKLSCMTTFGTETVNACGSYEFNGVTYSANNNTAIDTLVNANGCDSILQLDLTITTVDDSTTLSGDTITANAIGSTFQWINCADSSIISGATDSSYIALVSGDYAVIVTNGNCAYTSDCVSVTLTNVGITTYGQDNDVYLLYPNPTNAQVSISNYNKDIESITILDITGKVLTSFHPVGADFNLSYLQNGIYFVTIKEGTKIYTQKIVKR